MKTVLDTKHSLFRQTEETPNLILRQKVVLSTQECKKYLNKQFKSFLVCVCNFD